MTSRPTRNLLHDTQGAIVAEGAIVLPLFVIVLASMIYLHHLYAAKLRSSRNARSCAWAYSVGGCTPAPLPLGCTATDMADHYTSIGSTMKGGNPFEVKTSGSPSQKEAQARSGLDKGLSGASRVGLALIGLEKGKTVIYATDVTRPSILGGGKTTVAGDFSVMCNEKDMDPTDIAKAAFCALGKEMGFKGC